MDSEHHSLIKNQDRSLGEVVGSKTGQEDHKMNPEHFVISKGMEVLTKRRRFKKKTKKTKSKIKKKKQRSQPEGMLLIVKGGII